MFLGIAPQVLSAAPGAVYTSTNDAGANEIVAYSRTADGGLGSPQYFATGGMGTGAGLGSQGAIALSESGQWLLAVNAGSDDITVFSVRSNGSLKARSRTPSGGDMPISIALHGDMVFVLNAGNPRINGFRLTHDGELEAIPGAVGTLSGAGPAQVSFDDHGTTLVVTDKASNIIETFTFGQGGNLMGPFVTTSSGATPFGFSFGHRDILVVSEAAGGAPGASTVSSYWLGDDGTLVPITVALPTTQTAACWVAVTRNGKYAYTANTGSSSISSIAVGRNGALTLLNAAAGSTGAGTAAIDLAFSVNDRYLYALASGSISAFEVMSDGSLTPVGTVGGLPMTAVGLAGR
jgi:6-phosphogluconolactonase (cycloisomerase 2 family)